MTVIPIYPTANYLRKHDREIPVQYLDPVIQLVNKHNITIREYLNVAVNYCIGRGGDCNYDLMLVLLDRIPVLREDVDFNLWLKDISIPDDIYPLPEVWS